MIELRSPTNLFVLAASIACSGAQTSQSAGAINKSFSVAGVLVEADSLNAYLAKHRGFTSKGGEMRCAYRPLGQRETKVFLWAMCSELLAVDGRLIDGSGMSLPAAFEIQVESGHPRILEVEVPENGSGYSASIRRIFPSTAWPAIFADGGREHPGAGLQDYLRHDAAARFGLPVTAASAPRVHDMPGAELSVIDSGSFALIVRGDTTVVDEFVRRENLLEGIVRTRKPGAKFGWARYRVEFSRSGEVTLSRLSLGRVGTSPNAPAVGTYAITFGPDSIVEQWPNRAPTRTPYVRGTIPLFSPSIAMLQEVVRRARRMSPSQRDLGVPVYQVLVKAEVTRVPVRWIGRDTVSIGQGDLPEMRYVASNWKILSGQNGDFTIIRRGE
jgi:hypothetical protein